MPALTAVCGARITVACCIMLVPQSDRIARTATIAKTIHPVVVEVAKKVKASLITWKGKSELIEDSTDIIRRNEGECCKALDCELEVHVAVESSLETKLPTPPHQALIEVEVASPHFSVNEGPLEGIDDSLLEVGEDPGWVWTYHQLVDKDVQQTVVCVFLFVGKECIDARRKAGTDFAMKAVQLAVHFRHCIECAVHEPQ